MADFYDLNSGSAHNNDQERLIPKMRKQQGERQHTLRGQPRKIWTYVIDWFLVIGFSVAFIIIGNLNGHQREFSLTDQSIMFTYAVNQTVPPWLLVVLAVIVPGSILLLWTLFVPPLGTYQNSRRRSGEITWKAKLWDANLTLLGIGLALASTVTITNTFKNLVGRPRPDFLDRCQPLFNATNPTVFSLSNSSICTQIALLKDGYRSFPSGHSSLSFAGLGFLSLFIAGRLNVLDTRGQVWKTVVTLIPLVLAGFVAVSRLMNNRHHPFDVIVGSLLGFSLAWMAYRQYFPSIATAEGGRPYSIAEFATEAHEDPNTSYSTSSAYNPEPDLESGQPRQRYPKMDGDGFETIDTSDALQSPTSVNIPHGEGDLRQL